MASGKTFKESYGASVEFKGGMVPPESLKIVGVDIEPEDWNQDLWDRDRLQTTIALLADPVASKPGIDAMIAFACADQIQVVKRRDMILVVDGRTKTMFARAANRVLEAKGAGYTIEVPIVVSKNDDQTVVMRMSNAFRREDPPWVKARQASELRAKGLDERKISLLCGGVESITLKNWAHYMSVIPEIQRMVELPATGERPLPFAVAFEIGKLGKGETRLQLLALESLQNMGAQLTGEVGRSNVKAVVERIGSGEIKTAPPAPTKGEAYQAQPVITQTGPATFEMPDPEPSDPPTAKPRKAREPRENAGVITAARPKASQLNGIVAMLEPTEEYPHETDYERLAFAISLVYAGQDANCEGLEEWPDIQVGFQRALGVTVRKEPKAKSKAPKAPKARKDPAAIEKVPCHDLCDDPCESEGHTGKKAGRK